MKLLVIAAISILSHTTYASDVVVCNDTLVADNAFSASFTGLLTSRPVVNLYIPQGEYDGKTTAGNCYENRNSYGRAFTCVVKETPTTGYLVKLSVNDDSKLVSTVSDWSSPASAEKFSVDLPCK